MIFLSVAVGTVERCLSNGAVVIAPTSTVINSNGSEFYTIAHDFYINASQIIRCHCHWRICVIWTERSNERYEMVRITAQWILPMCQIIIIFCIFHSCQCLFSDVDCNYARKKIIDLIDPVQMEFQSLRKFRSNDQMSSNYHNLSLHLSHPISCHSATHNWLIFVIFSCEKENIQNSNTIKQKKNKMRKIAKIVE